MEHNLPAVAKKLWHAVRVAYFVLQKNVSRPRLLADLSSAMKRGKIAGKSAARNLVFHRAEYGGEESGDRRIPPGEYEFSCGDTPAHRVLRLPFRMSKRKRVTDSPFPVVEAGEEEGGRVDEAAERFIMNFYRDLKRQNHLAG
ncbi:Unknown protein [Striga hermonthica]|uniref:Avr9/Cf-9 rapidly elicited protein 146 n=1 Tax=Striga hermonthica TaxID=68872 RepID=A0A9N7NW15_STRHE|nr:Unknown protein [Striga hermonthica]